MLDRCRSKIKISAISTDLLFVVPIPPLSQISWEVSLETIVYIERQRERAAVWTSRNALHGLYSLLPLLSIRPVPGPSEFLCSMWRHRRASQSRRGDGDVVSSYPQFRLRPTFILESCKRSSNPIQLPGREALNVWRRRENRNTER